jgi:cytochrome b561
MRGTVRSLRLVQWAMLASIVIYGIVGEVAGSSAGAPNASLSYIFTTAGVAIVGVIFVVRRTLVLRSAETLAVRPEDSVTLSHWKTGYIATYALCESLALFGLILRFLGCNFRQCLPFYIGGFVLLFFFGPREPGSDEPGAHESGPQQPVSS